MSEVQKLWRPRGKYLTDALFFLMSIVFIMLIWPPEMKDTLPELFGSLIVVSSSYLVFYMFLFYFRSEILEVNRKTFFLIITILMFFVLTRVAVSYFEKPVLFIIPFAVIPVVITTFYDSRLALFILVTTILLTGFLVPDPFEFIFMNFIAGLVAIFSLSNIYRRAKLFIASLLVIVSYSAIYFAFNILSSGTIPAVSWSDYRWFFANGLLVLISYPLIFLFESRFLFLSEGTLIELSDINQPLLRMVTEGAPGSFQHSRQVANLAEEAARVIGANFLLTRAGALYHDIGKVVNSEYFIENQLAGQNPHSGLDALESSKLILNHVDEGVLLARKYKLPVQIIDFIRTHHGTTRAYYFYKKYLETGTPDLNMEKEFEYKGPKPFSKETAIVMMADAVEASSRTLEKYTEYTINELVERIVIIQEQDGQFSDAPLTFKDISDIKGVFKKRLSNIYHTRIVYPERDNRAD